MQLLAITNYYELPPVGLDLVRVNRTWLYKDLKVLDNGELAQTGAGSAGMPEYLGSNPTVGNVLLLDRDWIY